MNKLMNYQTRIKFSNRIYDKKVGNYLNLEIFQ